MKNNGLSRIILFACMVIFSASIFCHCGPSVQSGEPHVKNVIDSILATRDRIEKKISSQEGSGDHPVFFTTFWDFDGTILKGDCSEGYRTDDRVVYKGLIEICIDRGYSSKYLPGQFDSFWDKYMHIDRNQGHYHSIVFIPRVFAGADIHDIMKLSETQMEEVYSEYFFTSSIDIMRYLQHEGILVYVVSASPDFFVKGAARSLKVQMEHFYGVKVKTDSGKITREIEQPVTYADGKTKTIQDILSTIKNRHNTQHVYPIAGFGNSYHTDGDFLKWIASRSLPEGKAVTMMINGGDVPSKYKGIFRTVNQSEVVSKKE